MLTGSLPFERLEPAIALRDPQTELPQPPSRMDPDVPEARYGSVAQLVEALQAISVPAATTSAALSQAHPDDEQPDADAGAQDTSSNPAASKAPAFPFAPEASVSYRDILSSLHLEDLESPTLPPTPVTQPMTPSQIYAWATNGVPAMDDVLSAQDGNQWQTELDRPGD